MAAYGLYTHIRANRRRSIILLVGLFFLVYVLVFAGALKNLFALSEAYPDLRANTNFQQLQSELSDIENKLAAARRFFNNAVQEYNTGIQQFPAALFASMFGFHQQQFFDLGETRAQLEQAPSVKF